MKKLINLVCSLLFPLVVIQFSSPVNAAPEWFTYEDRGEVYRYSVEPTGDNYSFEFERSPSKEGERLRAVWSVLQAVYDDNSIKAQYSRFFTKEGARCFVFDANLYSYTACFLPNDFSPEHRDRFWGFVSRLPNSMWLMTRNLLPAVLLIGAFFFALRKKS